MKQFLTPQCGSDFVSRFRRTSIFCSSVCVLLAGCGDGERSTVEPPKPVAPVVWNSATITALAFEKLDADKNNSLSASELSPGLRAALPQVDSDKDGAISRAELDKRLSTHIGLGAGLVSTAGTLTFGGAPVSGITVTLEPEPFMASVSKPASGVTEANGDFSLKSEGAAVPAVQPGIYLIRLSSPDGKVAIPPEYGAATTLGVEVSGDSTRHLKLDL